MSYSKHRAAEQRERQAVAREYSWQMYLILKDLLPLVEADSHLVMAGKVVVAKIAEGEHRE